MFSLKIYHVKKEIIKLRVTSNLKKIKTGSKRSISLLFIKSKRFLAEGPWLASLILKCHLQILTISSCMCLIPSFQLWEQQRAREPADEPVPLLVWIKGLPTPSLGLQHCQEHSLPDKPFMPQETNCPGRNIDLFF